jgi:hypothetical protein
MLKARPHASTMVLALPLLTAAFAGEGGGPARSRFDKVSLSLLL